jgi:hypothetical protein
MQSLIISGPSSNRVDLVFFSDGCKSPNRFIIFVWYQIEGNTDTVAEREKFLVDAARLAEDISGNQTFSTVKPLLNFWAAFSPSREVCLQIDCFSDYDAYLLSSQSGIGKGGVPKE